MFCIYVPKGSTEPTREDFGKDVGYVVRKTPAYLGGMMVTVQFGTQGTKVLKLLKDANRMPAGEGGLGASEVGKVLKDGGFAKLVLPN